MLVEALPPLDAGGVLGTADPVDRAGEVAVSWISPGVLPFGSTGSGVSEYSSEKRLLSSSVRSGVDDEAILLALAVDLREDDVPLVLRRLEKKPSPRVAVFPPPVPLLLVVVPVGVPRRLSPPPPTPSVVMPIPPPTFVPPIPGPVTTA